MLLLALALIVGLSTPASAAPMGTAFTYEGRLIDANKPADGLYDLVFELCDSPEGPNDLDLRLVEDLDVADGFFTVELDFGSAAFAGDARWLWIGVRPGELKDPNEYTMLMPRTQLTPVPYAIYAKTAGGGGGGADSDWVISGDDMYSGVSGNVGIGTTKPQVRLSLGAEIPPKPKKLAIWDGINDFYGLGADWGSLTVYAGDEERMTIRDNGNVGIGTTSPGARLEVNDSPEVTMLVGTHDPSVGRISIRRAAAAISNAWDSTVKIKPAVSGDRALTVLNYGESAGAILGDVGGASGWFWGGDLVVNSADLIVSGGNVGIGTTTPGAKLAVMGGDVAIGTTTPSAKLDVTTSDPSGRAVYGKASDTDWVATNYGGYFKAAGGKGRAVYGVASYAGVHLPNSHNYGGYFESAGEKGRGVYGVATHTGDHSNYGGYFEAKGKWGAGVFGMHPYTGGTFHARAGEGGTGVWGDSNGTKGSGVHGHAHGTDGRGVEGWGRGYDFYAAGPGTNYGAASSVRWKSDIRSIDEPLDKLMKLRGVYFNWDAEHGGHHDTGMIAEEVGEVLPEIVEYEEDGKYTSGMDYSKLTPLLVEAVKELKAEKDLEIAELKGRLSQVELLRKENAGLRQRLTALQSIVAKVPPLREGGTQ